MEKSQHRWDSQKTLHYNSLINILKNEENNIKKTIHTFITIMKNNYSKKNIKK